MKNAPLRAVGFMLLGASSFAAMNAIARSLRELPWPMLAFARAYPEPGEFSPQAVANTLGRALNRSDAGQATFHTLVLPGGRCRQL